LFARNDLARPTQGTVATVFFAGPGHHGKASLWRLAPGDSANAFCKQERFGLVIQGVKDSRRWYRKLLVRWRKRTITAPVQLAMAKICYLLFAIDHRW